MYSSINKIQDLIFQLQAGAQEEITVVQSHRSPSLFLSGGCDSLYDKNTQYTA